MVKTDIVVEKSPLILIRDEQYEIVSLESEGKLNTDNYCKLSKTLNFFFFVTKKKSFYSIQSHFSKSTTSICKYITKLSMCVYI